MQSPNLTVPRIHFIENEHAWGPSTDDPAVWESGHWLEIDDATMNGLVGGAIFFHKTRSSDSYMGGRIIGFRRARKDEIRPGSAIFLFEPSPQFAKKFAGEDGWEPEFRAYRKIVRGVPSN